VVGECVVRILGRVAINSSAYRSARPAYEVHTHLFDADKTVASKRRMARGQANGQLACRDRLRKSRHVVSVEGDRGEYSLLVAISCGNPIQDIALDLCLQRQEVTVPGACEGEGSALQGNVSVGGWSVVWCCIWFLVESLTPVVPLQATCIPSPPSISKQEGPRHLYAATSWFM